MNDLFQKTTASMQTSLVQKAEPVTVTLAQTLKNNFDRGGMDALIGMMGERNAKMFVQNVVSVVTNPASILKKCEPNSIIHSSMVAAYTGLSIEPTLGQSALIPYKDQATFQVMRNGLVMLAHRTGEIIGLNDIPVYEGDILRFDRKRGLYEIADEPQSDILAGWLASITLRTGFTADVYMTLEELTAHASRYSKSYRYGSGLWHEKEGQRYMYSKTVIKRIVKRWAPMQQTIPEQRDLSLAMRFDQGTPKSIEILTADADYPDALEIDDAVEAEIMQEIEQKQRL
jgi:recombination protein RecT